MLKLILAPREPEGLLNRNRAPAEKRAARFRYYETKQTIGSETYALRRSRNGELTLSARTDLPFAGEEKKPLIRAALRMSADLTPRFFSSRGITPLEIEENTSVTVRGSQATVFENGKLKSRVDVAGNFFTMSCYIPVATEMLLIRYWLSHGLPA